MTAPGVPRNAAELMDYLVHRWAAEPAERGAICQLVSENMYERCLVGKPADRPTPAEALDELWRDLPPAPRKP